MPKMLLTKDIHSLSEFRSKASGYIEQVRKTRRPLVLTQHGEGVAVVMDIAEYDRLIEACELIEDIRTAEAQAERGEGVSHAQAMKATKKKLGW